MPKRERPKIASRLNSPTLANKQEELLSQLHDTEKVKKTIRFTMDIPVDIREEMLSKAKNNGQTLKGYLLTLVRRDLEEQ